MLLEVIFFWVQQKDAQTKVLENGFFEQVTEVRKKSKFNVRSLELGKKNMFFFFKKYMLATQGVNFFSGYNQSMQNRVFYVS